MTISDMNNQILSDFLETVSKFDEVIKKVDEILPLLDTYSQKCLLTGTLSVNEAFTKWIDFYNEYKEPTYKLL